MKHKVMLKTIAAMLMMGGLLGMNQSYANDEDEVLELMKQGDILPLSTILDMAQAQHAGHAVEPKLTEKHDKLVYKAEILDSSSQRHCPAVVAVSFPVNRNDGKRREV